MHKKNGPLKHKISGLCLDATGIKNGDLAKVQNCDPTVNGQKWQFGNYSTTFNGTLD